MNTSNYFVVAAAAVVVVVVVVSSFAVIVVVVVIVVSTFSFAIVVAVVIIINIFQFRNGSNFIHPCTMSQCASTMGGSSCRDTRIHKPCLCATDFAQNAQVRTCDLAVALPALIHASAQARRRRSSPQLGRGPALPSRRPEVHCAAVALR